MSTELLALIQKRKASLTRVKTIKPNPGRNRYRILPSWRTDDSKGPRSQFWMDFGMHYIRDSSNKVVAVTVCAEKTFNRPCEVCEMIARGIVNSTDDLTKKRLEDAKAGGRVLINVLHLDGPNPREPQVLELAPSAFNGFKGAGGIISLMEAKWPGAELVGGAIDVVIEKTGSGMDTRYGVAAEPGETIDIAPLMSRVTNLDNMVEAEATEQSRHRAIASVSSITGLLPAPSAVAPALPAAAAAHVFEDLPAFPNGESTMVAPPPTAPAPTPAAAPAPAQTPPWEAPAAAPAPVAAAEVDLEKLLEGL